MLAKNSVSISESGVNYGPIVCACVPCGPMSECHRSPRTRGMLGDRGAGRKTLAMVVIFAWNLITLMEFSFVIRLVG